MTNPYEPGEPGRGEGEQPAETPQGLPSYPQTPSSPTPPTPEQPRYGQYGPTGGTPESTPYPAASPYPGQTPYGQQPAYPGGGYQQAYGYPKNGLAVWSLVLGLVSMFVCGFIAGIPAIIVGRSAKRAVAAGEANNGGMATAGIVLGWIAVAFTLLTLLAVIVLAATGELSDVVDWYRDNANV